MTSEYQLNKEIDELKSKIESLCSYKESSCRCQKGQGERVSSQLTPENLRVLRLIGENSARIREAIEEVFVRLEIKPENSEKFYLQSFSIDLQPPDSQAPLSPWGPLILACCANGKYSACFQIGCDPCA